MQCQVPKRPNDKSFGSWHFQYLMDEFTAGQLIVVYNKQREELGEGTLVRRTIHLDLEMVAYECEEHTILARGAHYVRVNGQLHFVQELTSA